jgi:hypothetical protein
VINFVKLQPVRSTRSHDRAARFKIGLQITLTPIPEKVQVYGFSVTQLKG